MSVEKYKSPKSQPSFVKYTDEEGCDFKFMLKG
jgi:hypothetical protein